MFTIHSVFICHIQAPSYRPTDSYYHPHVSIRGCNPSRLPLSLAL